MLLIKQRTNKKNLMISLCISKKEGMKRNQEKKSSLNKDN